MIMTRLLQCRLVLLLAPLLSSFVSAYENSDLITDLDPSSSSEGNGTDASKWLEVEQEAASESTSFEFDRHPVFLVEPGFDGNTGSPGDRELYNFFDPTQQRGPDGNPNHALNFLINRQPRRVPQDSALRFNNLLEARNPTDSESSYLARLTTDSDPTRKYSIGEEIGAGQYGRVYRGYRLGGGSSGRRNNRGSKGKTNVQYNHPTSSGNYSRASPRSSSSLRPGQQVAIKTVVMHRSPDMLIRELRALHIIATNSERPATLPRFFGAYRNITDAQAGIKRSDDYSTKRIWIIMEWVEGKTLLQSTRNQGLFTYPECRRIMKQVVDTLVYLHERLNLVHGDLIPQNIMITDRTSLQVRLVDFGLSRMIGESQARNTFWEISKAGAMAYRLMYGDMPSAQSHDGHVERLSLKQALQTMPEFSRRVRNPDMLDWLWLCVKPGVTSRELVEHPFMAGVEYGGSPIAGSKAGSVQDTKRYPSPSSHDQDSLSTPPSLSSLPSMSAKSSTSVSTQAASDSFGGRQTEQSSSSPIGRLVNDSSTSDSSSSSSSSSSEEVRPRYYAHNNSRKAELATKEAGRGNSPFFSAPRKSNPERVEWRSKRPAQRPQVRPRPQGMHAPQKQGIAQKTNPIGGRLQPVRQAPPKKNVDRLKALYDPDSTSEEVSQASAPAPKSPQPPQQQPQRTRKQIKKVPKSAAPQYRSNSTRAKSILGNNTASGSSLLVDEEESSSSSSEDSFDNEYDGQQFYSFMIGGGGQFAGNDTTSPAGASYYNAGQLVQ